jgi:hypothetical protein
MISDLENLIKGSLVLTSYIQNGIAQDPDQDQQTRAFADSVEKLIVKAQESLAEIKEAKMTSQIAKVLKDAPSAVVAKKVNDAVKASAKSKAFRKPSKGVDEITTGENNQHHFKKKGSLHASVPMAQFKCVDVKHGTSEAKQNKAWCKTTLQAVLADHSGLDHSFRVIVWDEVQNTEDGGLTNPVKRGEFIALQDQWEVTKIVPKGGQYNKDFDEITIKKSK